MSRLRTLNQYVENYAWRPGMITMVSKVSFMFFRDHMGDTYIDMFRKGKINTYFLLEPIREILKCPDLLSY